MNCKIPTNGIKNIYVLTPEQISELILPEPLTRKVLVEKYKQIYFDELDIEFELDYNINDIRPKGRPSFSKTIIIKGI